MDYVPPVVVVHWMELLWIAILALGKDIVCHNPINVTVIGWRAQAYVSNDKTP